MSGQTLIAVLVIAMAAGFAAAFRKGMETYFVKQSRPSRVAIGAGLLIIGAIAFLGLMMIGVRTSAFLVCATVGASLWAVCVTVSSVALISLVRK